MDNLVLAVPALACAGCMALMMWMMKRRKGGGSTSQRDHPAEHDEQTRGPVS